MKAIGSFKDESERIEPAKAVKASVDLVKEMAKR